MSQWTRFSLFLLGLALQVVGFAIDKAAHVPLVPAILAPGAKAAIEILDRLGDGDASTQIPADEPGASHLVSMWPQLPKGVRIAAIARTVPFLELGGGPGSTDVELRALVDDDRYVKPIWRLSHARDAVRQELEEQLFSWGARLFVAGLVLSLTTAVWELAVHRRTARPAGSSD